MSSAELSHDARKAKESAELVIGRLQVPDYPRVYVLGCLSRPLTFHSQQHRAFNLIWALHEVGELAAAKAVAIVGGGLAGLTAAAAALLKGCRVTLFERSEQLFNFQKGTTNRYIHPNIYDWPRDGYQVSTTDLPCLNWNAGPAKAVVEQVLHQWHNGVWKDSTPSKLTVLPRQEISDLQIRDDRPHLRWAGGEGSFDGVVLAVGYGLERKLEGVDWISYWDIEGLEKSSLRAGGSPERVLVSGCGDGGLIDLLRLRIKDFYQEHLTEKLLPDEEIGGLRLALERVEDSAPVKASHDELGRYFEGAYENLVDSIPDAVLGRFLKRLRSDKVVVLNGPHALPYGSGAAPLNRFAAFLLLRFDRGGTVYRAGKIGKPSRPDSGLYHVDVKSAPEPWQDRFHKVVVRHGAEPALHASFPEIHSAYERHYRQFGAESDPTCRKLYGVYPAAPAVWRTAPVEYQRPPTRPIPPLPGPRPILVGRTEQVAKVKAELASVGLVVLKGAFGSGKTALALGVAYDLRATVPGRVWWVGLGSLGDELGRQPGELARAVGNQVQVPGFQAPATASSDGSAAVAALTRFFYSKPGLLVLDNCEHLTEPCSDLVLTLRRECPDLQLLITSREVVRVEGTEIREISVGPLALPDWEAIASHHGRQGLAAAIRNFESIRLFVDRADQSGTGFTLTDENARWVAEICRRVGGNPFFILLAAARVKQGVKWVALSLRKHLKIMRNPVPQLRHQKSAYTTISWSFSHLSTSAKSFLPQLWVFSDGWDADAARRICLDNGLPRRNVRALLEYLQDKSLVESDPRDDGEIRYRFLESTRMFFREFLGPVSRADLKQLHLNYFLDRAERGSPESGDAIDQKWLEWVRLEYGNIRAALYFALKPGGPCDQGLRLTAAIGPYWEANGAPGEGRKWFQTAFAAVPAAVGRVAAKAHHSAGALAYQQGDYAAARDFLNISSVFWEANPNNARSKALTHIRTAYVCRDMGLYAMARWFAERALALAKELGAKDVVALALNRVGTAYSDEANLAKAEEYYGLAVQAAQASGNNRLKAAPLNNLGIIKRNKGEYSRAEELHLESLELLAGRDPRSLALASYNLGVVAWRKGDLRNSWEATVQCLDSALLRGDKRGIALGLEGLGRIYSSRGEFEKAEYIFEVAEQLRANFRCPREPNEIGIHGEARRLVHEHLKDSQRESARQKAELADPEAVAKLLKETKPLWD